MREEGQEAARERVEPRAFTFDGWSMVPLDTSRSEPSTSEAAAPEIDTLSA